MSALADLQRDFLLALFDAGTAPAGVEPPRRFEIYRRAVLAGLHDALAAVHPVVRRLVGPEFFREAAAQFAVACPSTSGDLNSYGARFAGFLAAYAPAAGLEYLADVARLEWAVHESLHAPEAPALDLAALAAIGPERHGRIVFALDPSVRLVASVHAILTIWEANQPERDGTPARAPGGERVLVRREGHVVRPERLDADDAAFLAALLRGATLDETCDALGGSAADYLAPALARWAARRVIAGFGISGA